MRSVPALILACVAAGCAAPRPDAAPGSQAAASAASAAAVAFVCPAAGTKAYYNRSRTPVTFAGTDPADPAVCLTGSAAGRQTRRVLGLIVPDAADERRMSEALAPLFPLEPGKSIRYSYFQGYTNDPTKKDMRLETWTVGQSGTTEVMGRPIPTVTIIREMENPQTYGSAGARWTYTYAPDLHLFVKGDREVLRGSFTATRPFLLTRLVPPPKT